MLPRVGVYGTESSAVIYIKVLQHHGFKVVALWGSVEDETRRTALEYGIPFYTTKPEDLLFYPDTELVCVFGSPQRFAEVVVKALSTGKHVVCCRPAGCSVSDAEKMTSSIAGCSPRLLACFDHPTRHLIAVSAGRDLIQQGVIGNLLVCECHIRCDSLLPSNYDWTCDVSSGGGILQMYGSEVIDALIFLTGRRFVSVSCSRISYNRNTGSGLPFRIANADDYCLVHLKTGSGMVAVVSLNANFASSFQQEIIVTGSQGHIIIHNNRLDAQTLVGTRTFGGSSSSTDVVQSLSLPTSPLFPQVYQEGVYSFIQKIKDTFTLQDSGGVDLTEMPQWTRLDEGAYIRAVLDAALESDRRGGEWEPVSVKNKPPPLDSSNYWQTMKASSSNHSSVLDRRSDSDLKKKLTKTKLIQP